MKTAIAWRYRTKISFAPKRGYASCESKKCLPKGRQRAFYLLLKVSRIEEMLEAPRASGPVRVGLCRDSAPVKVIPQKLNLPMNFFGTFPESSLLSTVSKKKNNKNDRSPFSLKRYDGPILPRLCLY